MSYNMKSNFYPAKEPKNGYLGMADLTIANAIRIRGIAVFENKEEAGYHIQFPGYGEGENRGSYVVPASKEAYAQMLGVVEKAIHDDNHFGWETGTVNPQLTVRGGAVTEPYADARFAIIVEDVCTLAGVSTRVVDYEKDGKPASFVSVDYPSMPPYEKDGEKVYPPVYEGLKVEYEKDGEKKTKDFGDLMNGLVMKKRQEVLNRHPSLEEQVDNAEQKAAQEKTGKDGPAPEKAR